MSPSAFAQPRLMASYMPLSFSLTRRTFGKGRRASATSGPESASCTMCSISMPAPRWSATEAAHSFSQAGCRKLGVTMENLSGAGEVIEGGSVTCREATRQRSGLPAN